MRALRSCWCDLVALGLAAGLTILAGAPQAYAQSKNSIEIVANATLTTNSDGRFALSKDGRLLVSQAEGGPRLWDATNGKLIRTYRHPDLGGSGPVAISPDGKQVVSADSALKLWDAASGRLIRTFRGHEDMVMAVAFSPDGRQLLSGGWEADTSVKLWDVASGKLVRAIKVGEEITAVAFSPNGKWFAFAERSGPAQVRDRATGRLVRTLSALAFSPDSTMLALDTGYYPDHYVELWNPASGHKIRAMEQPHGRVVTIAYSPDGKMLLSGGNEIIKLWDATTGKLLRSIDTLFLYTVAFSADGKQLVSGEDGAIKYWDAATGQLVRTLQGGASHVNSLAVSSDGRQLLSGGGDAVAKLWDLQTGQLLRLFEGRPEWLTWIEWVAFTPDETRVLSATRYISQETIKLLDVASGQVIRTVSLRHGKGVAFSPDNKRLLSAGDEGAFKLWDALSGDLLHIAKETMPDATVRVAISPDGKHLVSGNSDKLWLYDIQSGEHLRIFEGHALPVLSVTFSPDGGRLASASSDKTVKIWDVASGQALHTLQGHAGMVSSVVFTPDGWRVVSASLDGTIRIWDAASGQLLVTLFASPEGQWVAITPEGFFAGSAKGAEMLSAVRGLQTFSFDQFYQILYRPDLVQEKLAGDPDEKVKNAAAKLDLAKLIESGRVPEVRLTSHEQQAVSKIETVVLEATVTDQGGGIGRAEWRLNGVTVGTQDAPTTRVEKATLKLSVTLDPGENTIELVAFNGTNQVSSAPARAKITWTGTASSALPRLHVLVTGINDYLDGSLRLAYAVPDAKAIGAAFHDAGRDLYDDVSVTLALNEDATIAGLDRIFREVASKVRPRDVFVFFAAGHGKTIDGRYYFLPQNLRYQNQQSIVRDAIGQDQLQTWFARIRATKSVLIFDTCEAGSLASGERVATRGGLEQKAALGRLIQATGRATLTASTSTQDAYEGYGGHGVFTFAILDALARGDLNNNGLIELAELVQHVDGIVPAITEKRWGAKQFPQWANHGSNFPLVRQLASLLPAHGDVVIIPIKPTHVATEPLQVFRGAGGEGPVVRELAPFTIVTLVKSEQGWALIASDGKALGYVADTKLHKLTSKAE